MSKADNMLSILWLLKSGRRMTAQQLADELEIHIRTVYRCIDSLCASGVPVIAESGHNGGYQILDHFSEAPLLFDMEEQKALIHASIFAREMGYPFTEELNRAIDKLKRYTNDEQITHMSRHADGLAVIHPPANSKEQMLLQQLEEAAVNVQSLEMIYGKGTKTAPSTRLIDPYGIVYWKGSWYTVGFCHLRQAVRSFRVDRIVEIKLCENYFVRPANFSAKDFLINQLLPDAVEKESGLTVTIQAEEQVLNDICKHWLFGHSLTERTAGEATFKLQVPSLLTYVPYFLLPYGKALIIKEPEVLIQRMAEVSSGMAAYYQEMCSERDDPKDAP